MSDTWHLHWQGTWGSPENWTWNGLWVYAPHDPGWPWGPPRWGSGLDRDSNGTRLGLDPYPNHTQDPGVTCAYAHCTSSWVVCHQCTPVYTTNVRSAYTRYTRLWSGIIANLSNEYLAWLVKSCHERFKDPMQSLRYRACSHTLLQTVSWQYTFGYC